MRNQLITFKKSNRTLKKSNGQNHLAYLTTFATNDDHMDSTSELTTYPEQRMNIFSVISLRERERE